MDVYIKLKKKSYVINKSDITVKDVADIFVDSSHKALIDNIKVINVDKNQNKNYLLTNIDVIKAIHSRYPQSKINMIGENETIIEYLKEAPKENKLFVVLKVLIISLIIFAGATTAIMSFHTDAQIPEVLKNYYLIFFGVQSDKPLLIEIPYSIGLAVGIIVFYNHFFNLKISSDPTPIEVEMTKYEKDVDECLLDHLGEKKE